MEPLRQAIQTLFIRQNPLQLLEAFFIPEKSFTAEHPHREDFKLLYREDFPTYTLDQIETVFNALISEWMKEDKYPNDLFFFHGPSVFNALLHYSRIALIECDGAPVCKYSKLLGWHELTQKVSEDLITLAFLAARDAQRGIERLTFEWPNVIEHDNVALNNMLSNRDVAELHAHLKGSSLTFELNWIDLMNHIDGRNKEFAKYDLYQSSEILINSKSNGSLYDLVKIAAVIRLYLFCAINGILKKKFESEHICFKTIDLLHQGGTSSILTQDIEDEISSYKTIYGKRYELNGNKVVLDYAIPQDVDSTPNSVISGDRQLIYQIFRMLLKNQNKELQQLLYIYLIIKIRFRNEMIHNNRFVGFSNFANYEGRKSEFLDHNKKMIVPTLATRSFFDKNPSHRYFEARLVPSDKTLELIQDIDNTECSIQELFFNEKSIFGESNDFSKKRNYQCFYIMHFIKTKDQPIYSDLMECRHAKQRQKNREQAESIYEFRQHSLNRGLIVAVDAANSEIFCRPEVFSQTFRYLRHQTIELGILDTLGVKRPQQLCVTYHVGEDFMDIVDGLRAVDEAIHFMGLKNGDRIGHGLVLGTDVESYYLGRSMMLTLKRHEWLDNVAWMYQECCKCNCSSVILQQLKRWYRNCYKDVYSDYLGKDVVADIDDFYQSWALRGDNPQLYAEEKESSLEYPLTPWDREARNNDTLANEARKNMIARNLYRAYHFNKDVRQQGDESISVKVTNEYIDAVISIQQHMLDKIQNLHIAIECNPTSNYRIGEFSMYVAHPLVKFFNHGLSTNYPSRSISISINTDDSGVFATSIEREYSLIALALEKDKEFSKNNSPRIIYDWLNRIRELSQEQRFIKPNHCW